MFAVEEASCSCSLVRGLEKDNTAHKKRINTTIPHDLFRRLFHSIIIFFWSAPNQEVNQQNSSTRFFFRQLSKAGNLSANMSRSVTYYRCKTDPVQSLQQFLSAKFRYHTCEEWVEAITDGRVLVNDLLPEGPGVVLKQGDRLEYRPLQTAEPPVDAENIETLLDDERMLVVVKSGNIPVAPGGRYTSNTLLAVLQRKSAANGNDNAVCGKRSRTDIDDGSRASKEGGRFDQRPLFLVHRIDKETSGIVVFAKTSAIAAQLTCQFADPADAHVQNLIADRASTSRLASKIYVALVDGLMQLHQTTVVSARVGFHKDVPGSSPTEFPKLKMAAFLADSNKGKASTSVITCFAVCRELGISAVAVAPKTGRTHQIRVHCAHIGFPIVGDKLYATTTPGRVGGSYAVDDALFLARSRATEPLCHPSVGPVRRHLLHAARLSLFPTTTQRTLEELAETHGQPAAEAIRLVSSPLKWFVRDCPKLAQVTELCAALDSFPQD
jgi:23S rRNA-/tRNA-specific pseudouridylate synthase